MTTDQASLLERIAAGLSRGSAGLKGEEEVAPTSEPPISLLLASASRYAGNEDEAASTELEAAVLFEALVEAAFLVAQADGVLDFKEQQAFQEVVTQACQGRVSSKQVQALLLDLSATLEQDGVERRVAAVARIVSGREAAREVLRVSALLAQVSGGVSDKEHHLLVSLAGACGLPASEVDVALALAQKALG